MKLRLGDLEEALRNPGAFVREQPRRSWGYSRYLVLRSTALDFHRDNDLAAALSLLERRLGQFKTTKGNDECLAMLREYASSFEVLGTTFVRARNNVSVEVPDEYRPAFRVTGQVARLDIHPAGGYRAWVFERKAENWQSELRFPLIQAACAKQLNVDPEEVVPGVYNFATGSYAHCQYTKRQIQSATQRLLRLLDRIKHYTS